jgi:hypothetical protein
MWFDVQMFIDVISNQESVIFGKNIQCTRLIMATIDFFNVISCHVSWECEILIGYYACASAQA